MMKKWLSVTIFILLLGVGLCLSQRKVLWGDEIFTQHTIDHSSYKDIITLHFSEGNKSPLFYLAQKSVLMLCAFRLTIVPVYEHWIIHDERSQVLMRLSSNIFMSLSLTLIFYFFTSRFSLWTGVYALAVALTVPMVWRYWAEARPYSLWFLLTVIQLCLAYAVVPLADPFRRSRLLNGLLFTHLLLSLVSIAAIVQIAIISILLWNEGLNKKKWGCLLPLVMTIFYYWAAPGYESKASAIFSPLLEVVMPEHLLVIGAYGVLLLTVFKGQGQKSNVYFLLIFILMYLSALAILLLFLFKKAGQFGFYSRYLIYMVPLDIMMMTIASRDMMHWARRNMGARINMGIFLGGLLICRALLTYTYMLALGIFSHTPAP